MDVATVETRIEADELGHWFRRLPPVECAGLYETLRGGLEQAKAYRRDALAVGDRARADQQMREIGALTALCAAGTEELRRHREWCLDTGQLWPLGQR